MDEKQKNSWPKSCAVIHMCDSVENGKAIHLRLVKKFGNLIKSPKLFQTSDGAVLQLGTTEIPETTYNAILTEIGAKSSFESQLDETLNAVKPDGASLYLNDRNQAFHWYTQRQFPQHDHTTEVYIRWYASMATLADGDSNWQEAWAGFHHALAGYLYLGMLEEIPDILWRLGRAHTGLAQYELAFLYLEGARRLAEQQEKNELISRVISEQAVLAKVSQQSSAFNETMDRLSTILFPNDKPSALASNAAFTLFQEGVTNQEWRQDGHPIKSCLIHAVGFYEVSLELNRRLNDRHAIAISLFNLGEIWKELDEKSKAHMCWQESIQYFEALGDDKKIRELNERLKDKV